MATTNLGLGLLRDFAAVVGCAGAVSEKGDDGTYGDGLVVAQVRNFMSVLCAYAGCFRWRMGACIAGIAVCGDVGDHACDCFCREAMAR